MHAALPPGTVVHEGAQALARLEDICSEAIRAGEQSWPVRSFMPGRGVPFPPGLHAVCPDHLVDVLAWMRANGVILSYEADLSGRPAGVIY